MILLSEVSPQTFYVQFCRDHTWSEFSKSDDHWKENFKKRFIVYSPADLISYLKSMIFKETTWTHPALRRYPLVHKWKWKSVSHVWLFVAPWIVAARLLSPWNCPGQNTGVGSLSLLQRIIPTQGSNPGLPHCGQILDHLSPQGSPVHKQRLQISQDNL